LVVLVSLPARGGEVDPSASFADLLDAKFQHARCLNCHHFNAADGMGSQPLPGEAPTSPKHRDLKDGDCHACHTHAVTGVPPAFQQWKAPPIDMDWTGKSAQETCQLIKQAHQGEFTEPTRMAEHLKHDRLIAWALLRGRVPPAGSPQVRDRVPGDRGEWITQVDAWINGGMRCD
jgi:cytochrome c551/c552